jgi:hypothetical protein
VPASPVTFGQPLGGVREIAAGGDHTCALMNDGTVQCWGFNNTGELGATTGRNCAGQLGGFPCSASPVAVAITDANGNPAPVLHIAAGYSHTCAAPLGGGIKCWETTSMINSAPARRLPPPPKVWFPSLSTGSTRARF